MLTKEEISKVYSQNLVLTKGTERWVPMTEKQIFELVAKNFEPEDIDEMMTNLEGSTFQVHSDGRMRRILAMKTFRILPIEGGELEDWKFSVEKPTVTGVSQNYSQTFYSVRIEPKKRTESIVIGLIRERNKLFFGSAGTDQPMKTEKLCPITGAELWYPPMLPGIYVMNSAFLWCLTPKYGYHKMFRFMWNVGEYVLQQAMDVESRLPFKSVAQKLINILESKNQLAEKCAPAEWEIFITQYDIDGSY